MDEDALDELLTRQAGVVTRAQALALGASVRQLRPGSSLLVPVGRGVFARAEDARGGPRLLTARAVAGARLRSSVDLVAAGPTAAVLLDLPLVRAGTALTLVERKDLRPNHHGCSRSVRPVETTEVRGVPVTTAARTAVDLARTRGLVAGVVAADAALAGGALRSELQAALEASRQWPGVAGARRAVALADGRSESPLESLGRVRFHEQGLPAPELQVVLGDADGVVARVDHYWPQHRTVAEADGALKYGDRAALFQEKQREDRLRDAGFEVVRYTWAEALRLPELVAARVVRAFARSAARRAA